MMLEGRRWLSLGLFSLSACGLAFQEPSLAVAEVRLASLGLQGGHLVVAVRIDNPNRYALTAEDLTYRISLLDDAGPDPEWLVMAEGGIEEPTRVEGGGWGVMDVDVPFEFTSVTTALGRLLRRGELEYRFTGALTVGTPLGPMRVPFDERGRFTP